MDKGDGARVQANAPARPPMRPATGVRDIKLQPHQMTAPVTATEDLFVLAHLGIPRVNPATWSLTIDGMVGRPLTLDLASLHSRPKTVVESVHNCCGSPTQPTVPTRRAANLRWGGVDLAALLAEAGVDPRAAYLWSYGLDGGSFAGTDCDWYVKDLPLARLAAGSVLLAYELNDASLPPEHGFPVRLVVPGFYGTNSVKWLWRIHLAAHRADGLFASQLYNDTAAPDDVTAGLDARRPNWAIAPDSVIVAPPPDAVLRAGATTEIWGWAWSHRELGAVEVSVDGGARFTRANLQPRRGWAWRRFSLSWQPDAAGQFAITARASDVNGAAQPADGARNAAHLIRVTVV